MLVLFRARISCKMPSGPLHFAIIGLVKFFGFGFFIGSGQRYTVLLGTCFVFFFIVLFFF